MNHLTLYNNLTVYPRSSTYPNGQTRIDLLLPTHEPYCQLTRPIDVQLPLRAILVPVYAHDIQLLADLQNAGWLTLFEPLTQYPLGFSYGTVYWWNN